MTQRPFVILDRDGTIIAERHYLSDPRQVELLPNAAAGLLRLRGLGFGLIVVTNQSGLSRGFFDEPRLAEIHARMEQLLADEGVSLDGIYVCPHVPEHDCPCRKPRPELVHRAARDLGFDPTTSIVVGDKECDLDLGRNVGALSVLVRTGYGHSIAANEAISPDYIVDDLADLAHGLNTPAAHT